MIFIKAVLLAIGILAGIFLILLITNLGFSLALRRYIRSFKPIEYNEEDQIVPEFDNELGHYTVRTDRDLKVMMLTDIHIGGGFRSYKKDKKTETMRSRFRDRNITAAERSITTWLQKT